MRFQIHFLFYIIKNYITSYNIAIATYLYVLTLLAIHISENVSVYPGEMAAFTCQVDTRGIQLVTFQWIRINRDRNVTYFNESTDIEMSGSGSTGNYFFNSIFNVINVNYTDNNVGYYCNASGCNVSMTAYLTGRLVAIL